MQRCLTPCRCSPYFMGRKDHQPESPAPSGSGRPARQAVGDMPERQKPKRAGWRWIALDSDDLDDSGDPRHPLCCRLGRQAPSSISCGIPVIRVARERAPELELRVGSGPRTRVRVVDGSGPPGRQSEAPLRAADPATVSRSSTVAVRPIGPMTWTNDSDDRPRVRPARASSATATRKLGALLR
jgi:hypothetical protein